MQRILNVLCVRVLWILLLVSLGLNNLVRGQGFTMEWELGPTGTKASLRAISVADDFNLWAAGSSGTIIRSADGGSSWQDCSPAGYEQLEFRSLHAWDSLTACAASAGTPAVILKTNDGGVHWKVVYENKSSEAFFDGLRFGDAEHGLAFSDPVEGRWLIVESDNGGESWQQLPSDSLPIVLVGEAAFAASNSALYVGVAGAAWIGTGGTVADTSRIFYRVSHGEPWRFAKCPIPSAKTAGVFSIVSDNRITIAVGGDYLPESHSAATAALSRDGGAKWELAKVQPAAFRSAVVAIPGGMIEEEAVLPGFIATGPSGTDFSSSGEEWSLCSEVGFHALATSANRVYAVGSSGRFARLRVGPTNP